jgi:hypothetical protein
VTTSFDRGGWVSRRSMIAGVIGNAVRLPCADAATLDQDGMLRIDGKRTFVHGLYQTPKHKDGIRAAAEAGFHVIHAAAQRDVLDKVRANGLRCWLTVGSDPPSIRKVVGEFRTHPAVLFWETEDEPSYQWKKPGPRVPPTKITAAYALLKQLDPKRLVYLNHAPTNLVSTLRAYNPGGDILATDIYPVVPHGIRELYALWPTGRQGDFADTHISQVGRYADKIRQVAGPSRATFMVLQAFAWENLREKDHDPAAVIYPTREQLRFMAWQSIVHGVNGILWWGVSQNPEGSKIWDDVIAVVSEMRVHETALSSAPQKVPLDLTYHDTGHSLDRGVEWIIKPVADARLMVMVNPDPTPVDVMVRGLPGSGAAQIIPGTKTIQITQRGLRIQLPPFGVELFRIANR